MGYNTDRAIRNGATLYNNFKRGDDDMVRVYRGGDLIWSKFAIPTATNIYTTSYQTSGPSYWNAWNQNGDVIFEGDIDLSATQCHRMAEKNNFLYTGSGAKSIGGGGRISKVSKNSGLVWNVTQESSFGSYYPDPIYAVSYDSVNNRIWAVGNGRSGTARRTFVSVNADTGAHVSGGTLANIAHGVDVLGSKWCIVGSDNFGSVTYSVSYGNVGSTSADWRYDFSNGEGAGTNQPWTCRVHSSGVYVGGDQSIPPEKDNFALIKFNTSGVVQWQKDGMGSRVNDIFVDSSDNVYAASTKTGVGAAQLYKYNSSGTLQWSREHGATLRSVVVDASGNVFVTGFLNTSDISTRKYNSSGTLQWSKRVLSPTNESFGLIVG